MIEEKKNEADNEQNNDAVDTWKHSFLKAPYLRDHLAKLGCIPLFPGIRNPRLDSILAIIDSQNV